MKLVLRQQKTSPLWRQHHQHTTPPPVTRWGLWSLSKVLLCLSYCPPSKEQGRCWTKTLCAQLELKLWKSYLYGNDCTAHTVSKVSSCVKKEEKGLRTLHKHKESQKQKQFIHQSDLTAQSLGRFLLCSSPLKWLYYRPQGCFWASLVLTVRVHCENISLLLWALKTNSCLLDSEELPEQLCHLEPIPAGPQLTAVHWRHALADSRLINFQLEDG